MLEIAADQGEEAINMEFNDSLGKKRDGCSLVPVTLTDGAYAMTIHFPSQVSAEAWFVVVTLIAGARGIIVYPTGPASGTSTVPTVGDAMDLSTPLEFSSFVTHAGKLFWAYDSGVNRLHVLNNDLVVPFVRRSGLSAPAAPTVANTGVGTYPAIIRYYRVSYLRIDPVTLAVLRMSNLGPPVSFTPSGVNLAARITRPALISEGETHWQIHASADNLAYYELGVPIDNFITFFDDATLPSNYALFALSPLEGANTPFPSVKYLASDGRHLFGFGVWETTNSGGSLTPVPGRVYFTPAIGTSDTGDDERVSNTLEIRGWIDMTPYGGAVDRGISGPVNNRIYVFQNRGIYVLVPTGDEVTPFARVVLTVVYGSMSHWSQVIGEDEQGQPALYFLDPRDGPRRIANGSVIQWLGHDVTDLWQTVNHESTGPAFGIYDQVNKLVKWWVPTGTSNSPDMMIVYDVRRGRSHDNQQEVRAGWSRWTGLLTSARCATMYFADWNLLKTTATAKFVPYVGLTTNDIVRQDRLSITDIGTPFVAFIRSGYFTGQTIRRQKRLIEAFLVSKRSDAFITMVIIEDFHGGPGPLPLSASINTGTGTHLRTYFQDVDLANLTVYQVQLGDDETEFISPDQAWELDQWHGSEEQEAGAR